MKKAPSLEDLKKARVSVRNIYVERKKRLTELESFAIWVTRNIGTMGFFFFLVVFNLAWIAWNVFAPEDFVFDGRWSFLILLFINNILQILFMPLIMVGQNLQGRYSEARAEADFEINTKAEEEIEAILIHLENQDEMMAEIKEKLDKIHHA